MIITTSWDDGHRLDLRLADILENNGLTGTFYIARNYLDERLSDGELKDLATRHELGAHTLHHPTLTEIPADEARQEIEGSKKWLEDVIGQAVTSFCYPKGKFTAEHRDMVEQAGYAMARTVEPYQFGAGDDRYAMPTTIHIYPFPLRPVQGLRGIRTRLQPIRNFLPHRAGLNVPLSAMKSWSSLAIALLEEARRINGIWHLWGHSWEIEKFDMWSQLEAVLSVAGQYQAEALTNTQVSSKTGQQPIITEEN